MKKLGDFNSSFEITDEMSEKIFVIPPSRVRYLSEIAENNRAYDKWSLEQKQIAQKLYALKKSLEILSKKSDNTISEIKKEYETLVLDLDPKNRKLIENWGQVRTKYQDEIFKFKVRDKELSITTHSKSLSDSNIPKISLPKYEAWGDLLYWQLQRKCTW